MKVSQLMSRKLITVGPQDSVETAVALLRQRGVRHLLVIEGRELVGIISDRDIKRALDPQKRGKKKVMNLGGLYFLLEPFFVREIMSRDVVSVEPSLSAQEAAAIMVAERFGALPVVSEGKLIGIITETDLLRYFAKAVPAKATAGTELRKR
jgi:acetoin utilization protein AcuB